jgi:hypothetical protein
MKLFYAFFLLIICGDLNSFAQKLPDVQSGSILAPKTLRIDGRNLEWSNFSAENKRTGIYYTVANDEKNIYFILKATSSETITKVFAGGISFSINIKSKKREEDAYTITYPVIVRNNVGRQGFGGGNNRQGQGMRMNRNDQTDVQRDSIILEQRKTQLASIKEIKVKGFTQIADSLISIYNEYGIKAVAKMDEQKAYFCEVAIPLSMLAINIDDKKEIAYQIKLNGRQGGNFAVRPNAGGFGGGNNRGGFGGGGNMAQQDLMMATDFWGKYVIQK